VTFEFNISTASIIRKGLIEIYPMTGKIAGGEK